MTTTTEIRSSYRKTKNGEWVVFGTYTDLAAANEGPHRVPVWTKAGVEKSEWISRTGRPFDVDGVQMVYGYIEKH